MAKVNKQSGLAGRFTLARDDVKHRTIATVEGEVGTGKTFFCLTAPGPILVQNIDKGTEGVIEQFRKEGKEIYEESYDWSPGKNDNTDELQEIAKEIRDKWEADYFYAIDNGIRSVIMDTESRIWQVYRYAEFGAPNDNPKNYDRLNQRFEALVNRAKEVDINLFLIRSLKDKWGLVGPVSQATGKKGFGKAGREVWGYEHLPGQVFTELRFAYDPADEDTYGDAYTISFGKCRHNASLQFTKQPRCSFPELGELMVEGSSREDWE
jgi:hypothetical protein